MTRNELDNMTQELRRGVLTLAVLSQLRQEHYGYSLIKYLKNRGLEIDQGTLYPLLRRLEANGLLESEWRVDGPRPRRYYQISTEGESVLDALQPEWDKLVVVMKGILS
jgi:PadR family transcriptional regulator PadR